MSHDNSILEFYVFYLVYLDISMGKRRLKGEKERGNLKNRIDLYSMIFFAGCEVLD
jgi:hypothetical protein